MSINNEKRMLVVFVSIAASECFALFFCLSRINNQKNAVADDSYTALSKSPKKKKKRAAEQPIPPNAKHTLDGGM